MANGLVITKSANGLRKAANGLRKAANGLLATGVVSYIIHLF